MKTLSLAALLTLVPFSAFPEELSQEQEAPNHTIKGILLVSELVTTEFEEDIEGVKVLDLSIPGDPKKLGKALEEIAIGKPISEERLTLLKHEIIRFYRNHDHPLVVVHIPEQDITDGVIQIVVLEGKLGKIRCKGNRWFNNKILHSYLDIEPGEAVTNDTLLTDVAWMNRNPFRRTDVVFTPGEEFGTTDIELVTKDRFPFRVYGGGDNTGNDATGNERWFAGFNWGNAFGCDHQLNFQYTTSSDFHNFQSYTANYYWPLPWRHIILLFGGFATVHPDLSCKDKEFGIFKSHGHSGQASFRYQIPLGKLYRPKIQEIQAGFDFKNTNNNLEFIGDDAIPIITKTVNIGQFAFGYNWGKETNHHKFSLALESYWSPGKIFPNQSNADFENLRPGAKNRYIYGKATLGDVYRFPINFCLALLLRGQLSSQNLLPSEQFGIGGYNTVRGYDEREVNVDNAFVGNLEVHSFPFHLFKSWGDELLFIGFLDYGVGGNHKTLPDEKNSEFLLGVGPGIRYTINPYLSLRVDWGFPLHKLNFDNNRMSKVHFGLLASY
jgi:hemolysin activation/secretion protein